MNLEFAVFAILFERDDSLDEYLIHSNGMMFSSVHWLNNGNRDDHIITIGSQRIRPNGESPRSVSFRKNFNVGNQESGREEYRALVFAIPEITYGRAWTNEVSINLG